jgi:hypothetical protein
MKDDHCTALPSSWDLTRKINHCCKQHDVEYVEQKITRLESDVKFYLCMLSSGINPVVAGLIYRVVRLFGWYPWYRRRWF